MIGCLRTRVRKQPIIALYFEFETVLKFYNLKARGLRIGLRFQLHPYLVYVISECSGESVYWRELALTIAAGQLDFV